AAGDYLAVSVTDEGAGMSADVLARVFEPFFTTKDVGHGTGLGLSMVYGFAKQSHGHVTIYSELGHGTRVTLYLPKAEGLPAVLDIVSSRSEPCGGETILMVEDNPAVL